MKVNYGLNRKIKKGNRRGLIEHKNHSHTFDRFPDTHDMITHVKIHHPGWQLSGWAPAKEEA